MNRFAKNCILTIGLSVLATMAIAQEPATQGSSGQEPAGQQENPDDGIGLQPNTTVTPQMDEATLVQKSSYIIGYNMTAQWLNEMKDQGVQCDSKAMMEGIRKAVDGEDFEMTDEEVQTVMLAFQKVIEKKQIAKMKAAADTNQAEGAALMAANAKKEGVRQLENGVQYEVLKEGSGASPTADDTVRIHYHGTLPNGEVFDSTVKPGDDSPSKPIEFQVARFVPGFSSALQAMKVGDKWKVTIPSELAYGMRGPGEIGPNRTLVFELELLDIVK